MASLGHPCKFQRVSRLGTVTARHSVGHSQTLRRRTEGATYIRQGGHHVGHWPTFLVTVVLRLSLCTIRNLNDINDVPQGLCPISVTCCVKEWIRSCVVVIIRDNNNSACGVVYYPFQTINSDRPVFMECVICSSPETVFSLASISVWLEIAKSF